MKKIIFIIFVLIIPPAISAEQIYILDFKKTLNESIAGKKAQKSFKNILEKGIKKINDQQKKNKEEENKIISQKKVLSSEEYKKKVSSLRKKVSNLNVERQKLLEQVASKRKKAKAELLNVLNPIITNYMKEKNIKVILDKRSVLMADSNLDVTDEVLKILNDKVKSLNID